MTEVRAVPIGHPPADHVEITEATPHDAVGIRLVIRAAMEKYMLDSGIPGSLDSMKESLDDLLRYIREDTVLTAKLGEDILGVLRISSGKNKTAYISRFSVLPGNQSLGIGSRLFAEAEKRIRETDATRILLHTALSNAPLVRFYEARNFKLIKKKEDRGYPRGLLEKKLS